VLIEIGKDGVIVGVDAFKNPKDAVDAELIESPLVPGIPNAHSHAFQRAFAGMAERASGRKGNFWNWRDTMYRFVERLEPEDMEPIAAQVFVEMLRAGYTSVCEFHYLHHRKDGKPHDDRAVFSREIIRAALETGIAITHMPALYAWGGFGGKVPADGQKRFLNTVSSLMRLIEELHGEFKDAPQVTLGLAHHSLRAVSPEMLMEGTAAMRALNPDAPIHMLVAAQAQEVEDCVAWSGRRPVEWLLENAGLDDKWCLVHATHMDEAETQGLAASGAVVALCPTSEANHGDGIFPLVDYFNAGGRFALGSGSHATVNPMEEMRWMEYVQRLVRRERTLLKRQDIPSVGATILDNVLSGGAQALGRKTGRIEIGHRADFIVLDDDLPAMTDRLRDHILDAAIFACNRNPVRDVMAGGRWVVRNRRHKREDQTLVKFRKVMEKLR
jgi:formimidoylglutamate deiminase